MEQFETEIIREAMRIIGRRTSEKKKKSSANNGKKGGRPVGTPQSEETKERIRQAQLLRVRRQVTTKGTDTPRRGRGRPRKMQLGEIPLSIDEANHSDSDNPFKDE